MNFDQELKIACEIAKQAGELALRMQFALKEVREKNPKDMVTEADLACDQLIRQEILKHFPDHGLITEEGTDLNTNSPYQWHIDPIDGTANYAAGMSLWGVSIAMEYQNQLQVGVVYCPALNQFFSAQRGAGAYCNNKRIFVSKHQDLSTAMVVNNGLNLGNTIEAQAEYNRNWFNLVSKLAPQIGRTRNLGAAVCEAALVALGNAAAYTVMGYKSWDIAAMVLIVQEAGGECTSLNGAPINLRDCKDGGLISNRLVHQQILDIITL